MGSQAAAEAVQLLPWPCLELTVDACFCSCASWSCVQHQDACHAQLHGSNNLSEAAGAL